MSSSYGNNCKITIFGQSHSKAIGVAIDGLPAGEFVDLDDLQFFLNRRAPGKNNLSTSRNEPDCPEILSGLKNGFTCGAPLTAVIYNQNQKSADYEPFADTPRPGHADYTAEIKYGGFQDKAGGGHFSGRLTAPLCIAGGIIIQLLKRKGIKIISRILSIGNVVDPEPLLQSTAEKEFPAVSDTAANKMKEEIEAARRSQNSVGGVVECIISGIPAGLGDPMFDGLENRIAQCIFAIPAVKGIEFGEGFNAAKLYGNENNDNFIIKDGSICTETNHCGGILGGISNGMPVVFRTAFKPTPSIAQTQHTVNMKTLENVTINVGGRHDPCVVVRAVPVVEAAAALAIYDALLEYEKMNNMRNTVNGD